MNPFRTATSRTLLVIGACSLGPLPARTADTPKPAAARQGPLDFNRTVRPILSNNCFQCHGPDEKTRKAKLRLDTKDGALAAAVVPGKPDSSELIVRLTATPDDASVMPPAKTGKKLTPREVETLRRW